MNKIFASLLTAFTTIAVAQAQNEDPFGTTNFDTAAITDSSLNIGYEENTTSSVAPEEIKFKPYVRIKMPIDTITELITYMGVVPFKPFTYPDNSTIESGGIDSLYVRARKYLLKNYGKDPNSKNPKDNIFDKEVVVKDMKPGADPNSDAGYIIITPTVPLMVSPTKYYAAESGKLTFRLEIRVKEGDGDNCKYKYKVTNFVHHTIDKYGKESDVYMEYYANSKSNPRGHDAYLIAIDKMVKQIVKDLGKVMPDPIVKDEDDF